MLIQLRARYTTQSKRGIIRVSKIVKDTPVEYTLRLFNDGIEIKLNKKTFPTIAVAISHASLYGFVTSLWEVEIKSI